jgi:hypothetical protein
MASTSIFGWSIPHQSLLDSLINILNGEIAMLLSKTPDGDREQIQKGLGWDRL